MLVSAAKIIRYQRFEEFISEKRYTTSAAARKLLFVEKGIEDTFSDRLSDAQKMRSSSSGGIGLEK